ncbi:putative acyl-CoA dehydrogenase ibr3 [Nowakowskiella sp. JEL0407]|nr:putative acyl-CoA dehydrogenase ibr3 [Nowakowskiella sp. JEL0407]
MTEPAVASSDATNIQTAIVHDPKSRTFSITGRKWWISGAGDPRCKLYIVMGRTSGSDRDTPKHKQQSVILVPADTPGITVVRPLNVFGYDDAPHGHCEVLFDGVVVPESNIVLGIGRGFEIVQGRLGPGRIHHCMRTIGIAERALEHQIARVTSPSRKTFGKLLSSHGKIMHDIGVSRVEIESCRLLVLKAADAIDKLGPKKALNFIAMAKFAVPTMALNVIDRAIQSFGAAGVCDDFPLAYMFAAMRTLRIADGPDEVHNQQIAKLELKKGPEIHKNLQRQDARVEEFRKQYSIEKVMTPIRSWKANL